MVDKCGLRYKMAPERTIFTELYLRRKKQTDRITVLICYEGDGSEKFELCLIERQSARARLWKKIGRNYGLNYHLNSKA